MGARRFLASREITADIDTRPRATARGKRTARGARGAASSALDTASHRSAQLLDWTLMTAEHLTRAAGVLPFAKQDIALHRAMIHQRIPGTSSRRPGAWTLILFEIRFCMKLMRGAAP